MTKNLINIFVTIFFALISYKALVSSSLPLFDPQNGYYFLITAIIINIFIRHFGLGLISTTFIAPTLYIIIMISLHGSDDPLILIAWIFMLFQAYIVGLGVGLAFYSVKKILEHNITSNVSKSSNLENVKPKTGNTNDGTRG